ncbi:MAG: hypothetical protein LUO96_06665, partial [Methanomicrobiales archaeon]|nr:hypothetical protein [Methanomicrobiales archaeon]
LTGIDIPERAIRELISSAINIIVQIARLSDGTRKISSISEIVGMEQGTISTQEIFTYEKQGVDESGKVIGQFRPTGIRPIFLTQMMTSGVKLPAELFNP